MRNSHQPRDDDSHSNYGSIPAADSTPSTPKSDSTPHLRTGSSPAITPSGTPPAQRVASQFGLGAGAAPRPSQLNMAPADGNSNYGQFPDPKRPAADSRSASGSSSHSSSGLGVTTGGAATQNYGMFPDPKAPASTSAPNLAAPGSPAPANYGSFAAAPESKSAPSLGIVTGGAAAPTAAAAAGGAPTSNYGFIPESRPSALNLGVSTGGATASPRPIVPPSANYASFDLPRSGSSGAASSPKLGIVTGGNAAPVAAPAQAVAPSNYGVIPTAGSSYLAAVTTSKAPPVQPAAPLSVQVTTNRFATIRKDEDEGDAFPLGPPAPAVVSAPNPVTFGGFPAQDDEFSPFPVPASAPSYPVGNENKRRRKRKQIRVNPVGEAFGYDVPDLDLAPLFVLPEPDINAPPLYEPDWSPELLAEALFDTMARGGVYMPPDRTAQQLQQQIVVGSTPVWSPTAYIAPTDGLAPSHSQFLMVRLRGWPSCSSSDNILFLFQSKHI